MVTQNSGGLPNERVRDAHQNIWIKSLEKINLHMDQASFDPLKMLRDTA